MRHLIRILYSRGWDFGKRPGAPDQTFMLATVPRSGSTYCAIRLWNTGMLGAPLEYLNFRSIYELISRLGYRLDRRGYPSADDILDYWRETQSIRTSPNGVFGFKMFTQNFVEISKRFPKLLSQIRPNHIIYLTRRDIVGQAISYSKARRSNKWFEGIKYGSEPDYDFDDINWCRDSILNQRAAWERIFERVGKRPIRITYEDLMDDESSVIRHIVESMGLPKDDIADMSIPLIKKQRNRSSEEWKDRFINEFSSQRLAS